MMVSREIVDGEKLEAAIVRAFADPGAAYLYIYFAAPGCYAARVERAQSTARFYGYHCCHGCHCCRGHGCCHCPCPCRCCCGHGGPPGVPGHLEATVPVKTSP
jgi:Protein of unknown function (DUF1203)